MTTKELAIASSTIWVVLAAILVNILTTHALIMHGGFAIPIVVTILWLLVFWRVRGAFAGVFQAKVPA